MVWGQAGLDSLYGVLGGRLPFAAADLRRVQQGVLPDGVGSVGDQGIHHLQRNVNKKNKKNAED